MAAGPSGAAFVGRGAGRRRRRLRVGARREAAAAGGGAVTGPGPARPLTAAPAPDRGPRLGAAPAWMGWKRDPREQVSGGLRRGAKRGGGGRSV